jgi:aspartyl-tRNA(Asn)/glutamyl-tRNA(Gln) amidotransferase subunit A
MTEPAPAPRASLHALTATTAAALIRSREISPVELVDALLARAADVDPQVLAWQLLDADGARAAARAAEETARQGGDLPPLLGVPFGAKDIYDTAGLVSAGGFAPYASRVPATDAVAVARLKRAGAILLGKLVTTQFAYADPSRTRNPWSAEHTPGGSSSGSAAGVAAELVPLALGSQTAGSILRPAAYNGVVGFKPSFGRISKQGVLPLAWTLDHVGVLCRSVDDCAAFLSATAGHDPGDPTSAVQPVPVFDPADPPAPPRLGLVRDALHAATPRVRDHVNRVAKDFAAAGAQIREVSLGEPLDLILAVHHTIMQSEAAAVHWQLLEQYPGAHSPRLRAYVEVGRLLPSALYLHAQRLRRRIRASLQRILEPLDALLLPTATDVAPTRETTGDPSLQIPFSLTGFPSLTLPSGLVEPPGLPLGVQLAGGPWQEARLFAAARWCAAQLPAPRAPLP